MANRCTDFIINQYLILRSHDTKRNFRRRFTDSCNLNLPQCKHLACRVENSCADRVEINAARDAFADSITAEPVFRIGMNLFLD